MRVTALLVRACLRLSPAGRGEELADLLTERARVTGENRVSAGDLIDLVGHGLEARWEWLANRRTLRFRQRLALVTLIGGAAVAAVLEVVSEPRLRRAVPPGVTGTFGPFHDTGVIVCALWLTGFACWWAGYVGLARLSMLAVIVAAAGTVPLDYLVGWPRPPAFVLAALSGAAWLGATARVSWSPARRRASELVALALLTVLVGYSVAVAVFGDVDGVAGLSVRPAVTLWLGAALELAVVAAVVGCMLAALCSRRAAGWLPVVHVAVLPWGAMAVLGRANTPLQAVPTLAGAAIVWVLVLATGMVCCYAAGPRRRTTTG